MPSEDHSRWPPCFAHSFREGRQYETNGQEFLKKTMNSNFYTSELQPRSERSVGNRNDTLRPIDFRQRWKNRQLSTSALLGLLQFQCPEVYGLAEVVGRWVWVSFRSVPAVTIRRQLAQSGFHWNRARQVWQHPCGIHRDRAFRGDPRSKYRSYFVSEVKAA